MFLLRLPVYLALLVLVFSSLNVVQARSLETRNVPEELKGWIPWVLDGHEQQTKCPFLYNDINSHQCIWPATLTLELTPNGASFSQDWQAYVDSWLPLPGSKKHWPQGIRLNGVVSSVSLHDGRPAIWVTSGQHTIEGRLIWDHVPESLAIPPTTGIIALSVNGEKVDLPDLEGATLWIRQRSTVTDTQEDRLSLQVYRHVDDDIPLQLNTHLQLEVSGKQREVIIGKPLLEGFIPVSIQSDLPTRLEDDGSLRLQLRPGKWSVSILARHADQVTSLTLAANNSTHWPVNEVWVFRSHTDNRLVEVQGLNTIDPRQTQLPAQWRDLPAYQLKTADTMTFKVIRRGDPQPAPDQLTLQRKLWLHFDGSAYTVQDEIGGSKTSGWRLDAQPVLQLGRVLVDGQAQFITTLDNQQQGVEVRRGALNVQAEGQLTGSINTLPAIGWNHDFKQVSAELQLPPGWRLFSVSGVDNVPGSWLQRWTLLDLFLVLIISISVARLWSWPWGLFALLTVVLLWHEPQAPTWIWLNLLAAIALLRVLPEGKTKKVMNTYRWLSLIGLIIIAIPFMVDEVRKGLYPQLERPWSPNLTVATSIAANAPQPMSRETQADLVEELEAPPEYSSSVRQKMKSITSKPEMDLYKRSIGPAKQNRLLHEVDPNANVQTGPGLPKWQWKSIPLQWNGPVDKAQQVGLVLISPTMNLFLNLLRVLLLCGLAALMLGVRFKPGAGFELPKVSLPLVAGLMLAPLLATLPIDKANAELPSTELLNELKTRLLKAPDCAPVCAQIPRMRISLRPQTIELLLEVHATEAVAIPLPGGKDHWLPQEVIVDGKAANGVFLAPQGQLWLDVGQGIHQVVLRGSLPARHSVQLPLPLIPHYVDKDIQGWSLDGLHENGQADSQLQLTRIATGDEQTSQSVLEAGALPPFVRIERTLRLGIDWQVETHVTRESPLGSAVVIEVPLLDGESITTADTRVKNGKLLLNMAAHERHVVWHSSLQKNQALGLTAATTTAWSETWRLDISPIWHVEAKGISVVHHMDPKGRWFPEYRPWPGESVQLTITRPAGVAGETRTIDDSRLVYTPGQRSMETELNLTMRSSQGGQHTLKLPAGAKLQNVQIDYVAQPIRQKDNTVTLPLHPGEQNLSLTWRESVEQPVLLKTSAVDLGIKSVNHSINIKLPQDRWVLFTGGPKMGPAVLFWGVLSVIILVAVGLGQVKFLPLKTWHWVLLGIGLSQSSMVTVVIVVGWLFAMAYRERLPMDTSQFKFNTMQIVLAILTLFAVMYLFAAVEQGLLGYPDMQVSGNQSSAYDLKWYQDRAEPHLPTAWVVSVPLLAYRVIMLLWSLWLAFALLGWLKWGWQAFSKNGLWRTIDFKRAKKTKEVTPLETDKAT